MSIQNLKNLREQAWIRTPLGDQFALHFDDTRYLELVAEFITNDVARFSGVAIEDGDLDPETQAYEDGYNSAVEHIVEHLRRRYVASKS